MNNKKLKIAANITYALGIAVIITLIVYAHRFYFLWQTGDWNGSRVWPPPIPFVFNGLGFIVSWVATSIVFWSIPMSAITWLFVKVNNFSKCNCVKFDKGIDRTYRPKTNLHNSIKNKCCAITLI